MRWVIAFLGVVAFVAPSDVNTVWGQALTVYTDADAGARIICRNDEGPEACFTPHSPDPWIDEGQGDWSFHPRYIRVHDQNTLDVGYWHFDLSDVSANAEVVTARFQLDVQSNSWTDTGTSVSVFAIADPDKDWDLVDLPEAELVGAIAPQSDYESFAWTGDPNDPQQRFNSPTPFLEEGELPSSVVRLLANEVVIPGTDAETTGSPGAPGNEYGGYAGADGPGTGGSSDAGDNPWPVKNVVDIDVRELVRWKLGQNPGYSDFDPVDRELTLMVRTDVEGGFVRFIAKESEYLGGSLELEPGRLLLDLIVVGPTCDFDVNEICDVADLDLLLYDGLVSNDPKFDLDGNGVVDLSDRDEWLDLAGNKNIETPYVAGDSNLDGKIDSGDLNNLALAWQRTDVTTWGDGDFDGNGVTNAADLNTLGLGWQHGVAAAAAAVPEPAGCIVLLFSLGVWLTVAGRRGSS